MNEELQARKELRNKLSRKVLRLLASQEQSRSQLKTKLSRSCQDRELVEEVLNDLENRDVINDERAALTYVQQRLAKGYGPWSMRQGLAKRGLPTSFADEVDDSRWLEAAQVSLRKKLGYGNAPDFAEQQKALRFLAGRGYPEHLARDAMDIFLENLKDD